MNKEDILTLDNNQEYMILDIITFNNNKYVYCVGIDKEEMPTNEYKYLKVSEDNADIYVEEVKDSKELEAIIALFTTNYLNDSINDEQDA